MSLTRLLVSVSGIGKLDHGYRVITPLSRLEHKASRAWSNRVFFHLSIHPCIEQEVENIDRNVSLPPQPRRGGFDRDTVRPDPCLAQERPQ